MVEISSTGTSAQPTSSAPLSEGSTGTPANIFSTTGGPPLILVFLAAGLLIGALVALLVLRRVYPQGGRRGVVARVATNRRRRRRIGEKPVLWDFYLQEDDEEGLSEKGFTKWTQVLPISAKFIPNETSRHNASPTSPRLPSSRPSFVQKYFRRSDLSTSKTQEPPFSDSSEQLIDGKLEVAVTIAMPRPPPLPSSSTHGEAELDYCLGLVHVPWKETLSAHHFSEKVQVAD